MIEDFLLSKVSVHRTGNNMIRLSPFISTSPTTHHPSPPSITLRPKTAARSCSLASPHHSQLTSDSRQLSWTGFCHKQTSLLWVEEVLIIILWLLWDSRRKILISKKLVMLFHKNYIFAISSIMWDDDMYSPPVDLCPDLILEAK